MTQRILYFLSPGSNVSPFDVTIAADAGFDQVIPLTGIAATSVPALVQDAIFCRPPGRFNDTGMFIGGRDVHLATDMFESARRAMVGDFQVGLFADPNGAYTTSASIVALVDRALRAQGVDGLAGRTVAVLGVGPVGLCTAVLAAREGASATLCALTADDDARVALRFCERHRAQVEWESAETHRDRVAVVARSEVIVCVARAGIRVVDEDALAAGEHLLAVADSNAVPPSGVEGIGTDDDGALLEVGAHRIWSVGPLAIGRLKYQTQFGLFRHIQQSSEPAAIDFLEAYRFAREALASEH